MFMDYNRILDIVHSEFATTAQLRLATLVLGYFQVQATD